MRVLFVSSEVFPYSKTGGLGDVVGSLPGALARLGHELLVISPWYATLVGEPVWAGDAEFPGGEEERAGVGILEAGGVRQAFVGLDDFRRESIYGYADDVRRFCRFCRAVPQVAQLLGFRPDIVHVHDWHSAYLPALLRFGDGSPEGFRATPTVLTIHNAQYQGVSQPAEALSWLGLPAEVASDHILLNGDANALRAGIGLATKITTVSPTYAREILTPEYGYGLEAVLQERKDDLRGILNGIDTATWDPAVDPHLPQPYSLADASGKRQAKVALCERAGLDPARPLIGVVSRLAEQKGIDLLLQAAESLKAQGWSIFVLGTGDPQLEQRTRELRSQGVLAAELAFDEGLAHLVYAAADVLAIPSRFEPCGLSQMVAMRYGTLPLARATGGLRDTIVHGRTGFLFEEPDPAELVEAAAEAMRCHGSSDWARMMLEAMAQDFSWDRSAESYVDLYRRIGSDDD
ncbi:MAG TPA: glycogen/starch synthase [Trueperaceae bacterium]